MTQPHANRLAARLRILDLFHELWQEDPRESLTSFRVHQRTGLSVEACERAVATLHAEDLLEAVEHVLPDGGWVSYRYRPPEPVIDAATLGPRSRLSPLAAAAGQFASS